MPKNMHNKNAEVKRTKKKNMWVNNPKKVTCEVKKPIGYMCICFNKGIKNAYHEFGHSTTKV